jgi:hypothetical protein
VYLWSKVDDSKLLPFSGEPSTNSGELFQGRNSHGYDVSWSGVPCAEAGARIGCRREGSL